MLVTNSLPSTERLLEIVFPQYLQCIRRSQKFHGKFLLLSILDSAGHSFLCLVRQPNNKEKNIYHNTL